MLIRSDNHQSLRLPPSTLELTHADSAFDLEQLFSYQVDLPPTGPLGLLLEDDRDFGLPLIVRMQSDSPFLKGCKKSLTKNAWIVSVHHDEPITVERLLQYLEHLRATKVYNITVTLSKRPHPSHTELYQEFRLRFDQMRPITNFSNAPKHLIAKYAIHSPVKPDAPTTFKEFLDNPYKEYWIKSMFERYTKFHNAGTWSAPIQRSKLPANAIILDAVSTFKIKQTDSPTMWDLNYRPCSNGGPMKKGIDYDESHASTASHQSIRMILAVAAKLNFRLFLADIGNAFQSTPRQDTAATPPIYMKTSPLYLDWFNMAFPKLAMNKKDGPYVVQLLVYMQGTPPASREFYILLAHLLADIGIYPTSIDNGVFVIVENDQIMVLAIETDDLLIATNSDKLKNKVLDKIKSAFDITL